MTDQSLVARSRHPEADVCSLLQNHNLASMGWAEPAQNCTADPAESHDVESHDVSDFLVCGEDLAEARFTVFPPRYEAFA